VAYLLVLWPLYHRRTRGVWNPLLHVWLALILVSVLPVYQHHFVDVVGGAGLAALCWYLFPEARGDPDRDPEFTPRPDLAALYGAGAAGAWGVTPWLGRWGAVSAWVGLSLMVVACAYGLAGPRVFRKANGRVHVGVRALLWPYLLGLWATRWYFNRRAGAPLAEVGRGVIIGRRLRPGEAGLLRDAGVSAVLDLTVEHSATGALRQWPYLNVPILDLTVPTESQCREGLRFIESHAASGPVFVQCGLGRSRSATVAGAYLLASDQAVTAEEACERVRARRPEAALGGTAVRLLRRFEHRGSVSRAVSGPATP
jgi:predicted protein tyrosine phosphatase